MNEQTASTPCCHGSEEPGTTAPARAADLEGKYVCPMCPDVIEDEPVLTPRRAALVSGENLARWAVGLDLGAHLRLGRGEDQMGGRTKPSVLATALEAVLGVIYREGGLDACRRALGHLAVW